MVLYILIKFQGLDVHDEILKFTWETHQVLLYSQYTWVLQTDQGCASHFENDESFIFG